MEFEEVVRRRRMVRNYLDVPVDGARLPRIVIDDLGVPLDHRLAPLLLALEGRFDSAATSLEEYLAANPDMNPALQRLVHAHLGYYLRRAGRVAAETGAKVALAEEYRMGGTCVIRGCVPKKLLVYASRYGGDLKR